jgi:hypothetical protein
VAALVAFRAPPDAVGLAYRSDGGRARCPPGGWSPGSGRAAPVPPGFIGPLVAWVVGFVIGSLVGPSSPHRTAHRGGSAALIELVHRLPRIRAWPPRIPVDLQAWLSTSRADSMNQEDQSPSGPAEDVVNHYG